MLLAGCGGEEYPVPASEAYAKLSGVGTRACLQCGRAEEVAVSFESLPSKSGPVELQPWRRRLAKFIAKVEPNGDSASIVSLHYVEGSAPDGNWRNKQVRRLLRNEVQRLVIEAVDSKMESRSFDMALRADVSAKTASASMGAIIGDVSKSMDAEVERRAQRDREDEARAAANSHNAAKPSMDLSKYN